MEKVRILGRLVKEQDYSFKPFTSKCGLPYTTSYGIMKNGAGKATADNIMAICHGLGITMDDLEKMVNDKKIIRPESTYADVERLVARNGRQISADQKLCLIKLLSEIGDEDRFN